MTSKGLKRLTSRPSDKPLVGPQSAALLELPRGLSSGLVPSKRVTYLGKKGARVSELNLF